MTHRPAHGAPLTGTFWVSVVTRCALLTVLSSVVGQAHTLAARTAPAVGHASAATRAACRGASVLVHVRSLFKGSHDCLCPTHPGRTGRSETLVGSGRSAPRRPPGGTGSGLTCHTPPALSLCSHTHTLRTNMRKGNDNHDKKNPSCRSMMHQRARSVGLFGLPVIGAVFTELRGARRV